MASLEATAASILKQAVDFDNKRRFVEALTLYKEGIDVLLKVLKESSPNSTKYQQIRERIEEYMNRAEKIKIITEKEKENLKNRKQIVIKENDIGYSYDTIFGPLINDAVSHIQVEDAYVRANHQLLNFVRFCELAVKCSSSLKKITLCTGEDNSFDAKQLQKTAFEELKKSLKLKKIDFIVHFSDTLHDREIKFDNGWVVKIGRGLDYFKPVPKFSIGFCDYNLRPCYETTVDIFHTDQIM